jgi:hypothetical protein
VKQGKSVAGFKRNPAPASKWLHNALSVTSLCIVACPAVGQRIAASMGLLVTKIQRPKKPPRMQTALSP